MAIQQKLVGVVRFELTTPCTQNRCASQATPHSVRYKTGGDDGARTRNFCRDRAVL